MRQIEASLPIGSVLIQGPIGVGKSSLLARAMDLMTGFNSDHKAQQVTVVTDKNVETVDQAARLVLDGPSVNINDAEKKLNFKLGIPTGLGEFGIEVGAETVRNSQEGRHLAVLKKILESDFKRRSGAGVESLLIHRYVPERTPRGAVRMWG